MYENTIRFEMKPPCVETPEIREWLDRVARLVENEMERKHVELMVNGSVEIWGPADRAEYGRDSE